MSKYCICCLVGLALFVSCSVRAPEVQVTGEKTALENQVIGTYEQMQDDSWMVASTRDARNRQQVVISTEKDQFLEARQNREFNRDDINEFKKDGALGENNQGMLELRPLPKLDSDPEYRKLVVQIMEEENRDRKIMYDRVIQVNTAASEAQTDEVYAVFAKFNRENTAPGCWIQLPDGAWIKKEK